MTPVLLHPFQPTRDALEQLQSLFEKTPTYHLRVHGSLATQDTAKDALEALPPGVHRDDKFVFGAYLDQRLVGFVDLIRGYPDRSTAMLGLLLVSETEQRRGLGRDIYRQIESFVSSWIGIFQIRIAVVETNSAVLPFWEKLGFQLTGEKKTHRLGSAVEVSSLILQKQLASGMKTFKLAPETADSEVSLRLW
jgi:RimJ/RimL family protein N-acetyltransferase